MAKSVQKPIKDVEFTANARLSKLGKISTHRFSVDKDGVIRVWDDVAHHFTTCHDLSKYTCQELRHMAACIAYGCEVQQPHQRGTVHHKPCPSVK